MIKNLVTKKNIYLLSLLTVVLLGIIVVPTYAKFASNYSTTDDVVGFSLDFNIGITGVEEYEEIIVSAGSTEKFNVEIQNADSVTNYYGIWYKMINPSSITDDISIGKLDGTEVATSGSINASGSTTVTIGIINNSDSDIKLYIGVGSSNTSTSDIEYLNGKYLITGTVEIIDYSFSKYIMNLYNDGSALTTTNIGGSTSNPSVSLNTTQGIMLDNNGEYRYYGANPNNYVEFNDELWRIISVSNVKSSTSDSVGEQRIKLIRADSIGEYPIGTNGDWDNAEIQSDLNSLYYNRTSGTCSSSSSSCDFTTIGLNNAAKNLISEGVWYYGASEDASLLWVDELYNKERLYDEYSFSTFIGLMNASDYGYAADLNSCNETLSNYGLCADTNWLFLGADTYEWTMTPYFNEDYRLEMIGTDGTVSYDYSDWATNIRPVVYLKANVVKLSGSGTSGDPYKIGFESDMEQEKVYLNTKAVGSYVAYTGNNGCSGDFCSGQNANSDSTTNGWCTSSTYEYANSGWRIAYIENDYVHLISAGAVECMSTSSSGSASSSNVSDYETTTGTPQHMANLNNITSKYCNLEFAMNGLCTGSVWPMNANDFYKIMNKNLSECHAVKSDACGQNNDLITIGGTYWFGTTYSTFYTYNFSAYYGYVSNGSSNSAYGVRPVIKLDSSVLVTGGSGSSSDPYQIELAPDKEAPVAEISTTSTLKRTTQTATLTCTDDVGVVEYYWGTTAPTETSTYTSVTSTTSMSVKKTVSYSAAGTYYLACKDEAGNVSTTVSKTYNTYKVYNLLQNLDAGDELTTANYTLSSNYTYIAPNGTTLTRTSIYATPTGGNYSGASYSLGVPSTTAATAITSNPTLSSNDIIFSVWFPRAVYTITYSRGTYTQATLTGTLPASQTKLYGETITLSTTTLICVNLTYPSFKGWSTLTGQTTATYAPGATYSANTSVTLYAVCGTNSSSGGATS